MGRLLIFLSAVLAILGGTGWYLVKRSTTLCPLLARHPAWAWGPYVLFVGLLLFLPPLQHALASRGEFLAPLQLFGYLLFSFISTFLPLLLAADLLQAGARRLLHAPPTLGAWAFGAAFVLSLAFCLLGFFTARGAIPVVRVEIPVEGLDPELDGLRIVQLSDLHIAPGFSDARVRAIAAQVQAQAPDLVAVTGDLVDGSADGTRAKVELLAALRAPMGVCFVTGNHERYAGLARWLEVVRGMGWQVLDNGHVVHARGKARLVVAGVPDPAHAGPDLGKALAGAPAGAPVLLLRHRPEGLQEAARAGVTLQLSGHVHGGQYFPWSPLVRAFHAHPSGLARLGRTWLYTSRGTGTWGPPNRFLVPPELTVLVLRRA